MQNYAKVTQNYTQINEIMQIKLNYANNYTEIEQKSCKNHAKITQITKYCAKLRTCHAKLLKLREVLRKVCKLRKPMI